MCTTSCAATAHHVLSDSPSALAADPAPVTSPNIDTAGRPTTGASLVSSERRRTPEAQPAQPSLAQFIDSDALIRQLVEGADAVVYVCTPDLARTLYLSPSFERIWGVARATMTRDGGSWLERVHAPDRELLRASALEERGGKLDIEYRITRADGALRWVRDRAFAVRDGSGAIVYRAGIVEDVTERKEASLEKVRLLEETARARASAEEATMRLAQVLDEERGALRSLRETDERLRLAVESANLGTWDFSPISGTLDWSDRCKAIFGLPLDAAVTYDVFLECLHPDDRERTHAVVQRTLQPEGNGEYDVEFRIRRWDGTVRWVLAKGRAFFEGAGAKRVPSRFIGTVIDITERRLAEGSARMLAEASTLLASSLDLEVMLAGVARLAVQSFADFVVVDLLDEDGAVDRAVAVHGDPVFADLLQRARHLATNPDEWPADDPVRTALRTQQTLYLPVMTTRFTQAPGDGGDGTEHLDPASMIVVPLMARGRAVGAVTFARGHRRPLYSERDREVAEELARRTATAIDNAQLYRAAVAASEAKSTFLASMSHELRTPLSAIIGYEELLADGITGPVTEPQRQQLSRIKASATHLLGLIDEILTYSRVEAGSERTHVDMVDVRQALEDSAGIVAPLVSERGLALTIEPVAECTTICTDAQKLRQILVNLLSNATKFTERGGIVLGARRVGRQILFTCTDSGVGIAPEHLQRIFEAFWQAEQRPTRRVGGTGLGLTVSRRLAHLLGGDLTVESRLGQGTTFTLQLPLS